MAFFGFDATLPRDRGHPSTGLGFGAAPDPFAGISSNRPLEEDNDDAINFDDTYDGLGDQLEEANDDFNADTFGDVKSGSGGSAKPVGKDFDFFGQTAKVSDAINEEQARFVRQQPPTKSVASASEPSKHGTKPYKSGYEVYKTSGYIPELQANASIWGTEASKSVQSQINTQQETGHGVGASQQRPSSGAPAKKMMSLEEVEASMRAQAKKSSSKPVPHQQAQAPPPDVAQHQLPPQPPPQSTRPQSLSSAQFPPAQQQNQHHAGLAQVSQAELPRQDVHTSRFIPGPPSNSGHQILQRGQPLPQQAAKSAEPSQPRQILQNPRRQQAQLNPRPIEPPQMPPRVIAPPNVSQLPIITHPRQLMHFSEQERTAFLVEDAKRAKRNHKIYMLSKDNGLMTPQDKNFITRIQLQQLMTATGNVNEQDPDASLSEDFYYQVHSQIRGGPRHNPQQPLSNFAQTYLFQTGSRQGGISRRQNRGGDNHMQRMEQQVQRAVEAAKLKPKNKQLVIEGSLGKISFSNAKTPKPLLNIKRNETAQHTDRQAGGKKASDANVSTSNRKAILKNIEAVYSTLMMMEDHERRLPPPVDESDSSISQLHIWWHDTMRKLNEKLWSDLKVMEPIIPESTILHPFIAFLAYPKGKKAIPRIFRHIDQEQRLTILTMIVIHLNVLDVIRLAQPQPNETQLPSSAREEVDLFSQAVMPSLFAEINDAPLGVVDGLLELILTRVNMRAIACTKVGQNILTMLISRAELVKQGEAPDDQEWDHWLNLYNRFFDTVEPLLADIFPGSINAGQDEYVWRFLAACGIGASPDQQQRLVIAVKDRVMETVAQSKTLPPEMATQRLGNVNLFMVAIGLDVDDLLG